VVHIAAVIAQSIAEQSQRTEVTADVVVQELAAVAFANMLDYAVWGPDGDVKVKSSRALTRTQGAGIVEVSSTRRPDGTVQLG
jgi:phage terminase small subunit